MRIVGEEVVVLPVQARLPQAVGVLAAEREALGQIVGDVHGHDVALLDELDRDVLRVDLIRGRDVVEIRVLGQRMESVV
jgi:hypothetical protein